MPSGHGSLRHRLNGGGVHSERYRCNIELDTERGLCERCAKLEQELQTRLAQVFVFFLSAISFEGTGVTR